MKKKFKYLICGFLLLASYFCMGQNATIDSLQNVVKTSNQDSTKVKALLNLFQLYEFTDIDKATQCINEGLSLAQKCDFKKGLSKAYLLSGYFAEDKAHYNEALKYYKTSLEMNRAIGNKRGMADSYINIGNVYTHQGNYAEVLKNYLAGLKIYESIDLKTGIAASYDNIGSIYATQGNYDEALKNHNKSLKIFEALNDQWSIAYVYNNIGIIYYKQSKYEEALKNHFASLKIKKELDDKSGMANSYNCIGAVYCEMGNYALALENHFASLKIEEKIDDKNDITASLLNIGIAFTKQKKYSEAEAFLSKTITISKQFGLKPSLRDSFKAFSRLDSAKGNFKGAYLNNKLFILYRDSLDNEEVRKKTVESQLTYDFEVKEAVAQAEYKKELENQALIANEKSLKQRLVLILVSCFLAIVVCFAGFIIRSLRITRKQKRLIETQKNIVEQQKYQVEYQKSIVEEHQKETIDSITYARRIQRSLLPTESYIEKNLIRLKGI